MELTGELISFRGKPAPQARPEQTLHSWGKLRGGRAVEAPAPQHSVRGAVQRLGKSFPGRSWWPSSQRPASGTFLHSLCPVPDGTTEDTSPARETG